MRITPYIKTGPRRQFRDLSSSGYDSTSRAISFHTGSRSPHTTSLSNAFTSFTTKFHALLLGPDLTTAVIVISIGIIISSSTFIGDVTFNYVIIHFCVEAMLSLDSKLLGHQVQNM